jgi:hypothetical protein
MLELKDDLQILYIEGEDNHIESMSSLSSDKEEFEYQPYVFPPPNSLLNLKVGSRGAFKSNITLCPPTRMKVVVNKLMTTSSMFTQSSVGKMQLGFLTLREL